MATTPRTTGVHAPVSVSDDLAAIVGKGPMPRTEVTKKVWEYIKKNNLQGKVDKRSIEPDGALGKVIGTKPISMFAMTAAVSKHLNK